MDWENKGIGEVVAVLASAAPPPTDQAYRFIKLAAGESFVGGYNEGIITGEVVSGSYPNVIATGVISDSCSPFDGQTVNLISTEFSSSLRYYARIS
ncbi:hypothetical protein [Rhizobium lentis]|uniref:hypothetical protein n=1 Tax=Rhizobium lentis TaxID=1138194 RepID=UPI001C83A104|nr:hypothetical protein [Rhizobium lentis]